MTARSYGTWDDEDIIEYRQLSAGSETSLRLYVTVVPSSDVPAALDSEETDWARTEAATLRAKSPETVKVALRQLREGRAAETFQDNMRMEFRIGWRKVQSADFLEGVRAVIIDKDNAPVWKPTRLEDVKDVDVACYFEPLGPDELSFGAAG
jgi:enoyl-CoA hydratase